MRRIVRGLIRRFDLPPYPDLICYQQLALWNVSTDLCEKARLGWLFIEHYADIQHRT